MTGVIDLVSPSSYAHGHPTEQYAWLRDNEKIGETEWQPSTFISGPKHIRVRRRRI